MGKDRHILVINPNTTASMTEKIRQAARAAAGPDIQITAVNPEAGPAAIQGPEDGWAALPGLYRLVDDWLAGPRNVDAIIIACFDDTGLWELKQRCPVPVLGIGEAAYHMASLSAVRFSVVTTLSVSIPVLEGNLRQIGLMARCAKVRASEVPVLALEENGIAGRSRIEAEITAALAEDNIGAIALGCAGMTDLAEDLCDKFKIPIIDGVAAAVKLIEALPMRYTAPAP
ncbi:aspartate/glutamate racemase family protein [Labrenzia sp. 011]|uniref:aspartate/glutamate racemase family protein n=1 Tax=Labrenzia sp. 011 TaxID=2171494 RepID=UPI000D5179C3|nr:aspartate/glutamate racemase family protein [Labrenzia sp. 011]PVB60625.1 Asp/Glu/hydantoin racemase [Labrenzia sp. 011]